MGRWDDPVVVIPKLERWHQRWSLACHCLGKPLVGSLCVWDFHELSLTWDGGSRWEAIGLILNTHHSNGVLTLLPIPWPFHTLTLNFFLFFSAYFSFLLIVSFHGEDFHRLCLIWDCGSRWEAMGSILTILTVFSSCPSSLGPGSPQLWISPFSGFILFLLNQFSTAFPPFRKSKLLDKMLQQTFPWDEVLILELCLRAIKSFLNN